MQVSDCEARIVKVIDSCQQPDQLKNCGNWVEDLRVKGVVPPASAERLSWLVAMKLDDRNLVQ